MSVDEPQPSSQNQNQTQSSLPTLKFVNRHHAPFHQTLLKRKLNPTRHYYQRSMRDLGIDEDLRSLLDNLGMSEFIQHQYPTFKEPTYEFLASFEKEPVGNNEFQISFQLFNARHVISLRRLNELLDFNPDADLLAPSTELFPEYDAFRWWRKLPIWMSLVLGTRWQAKLSIQYSASFTASWGLRCLANRI